MVAWGEVMVRGQAALPATFGLGAGGGVVASVPLAR